MIPSPPLHLVPRVSRRLAAAVLTTHLLAAAALLLADLPGWAVGMGLAGLAASGLLHLRPPPAPALRLEPDGGLQVRTAEGEWQPARVLPDSHVTPWLVVLHYRPEGSGRPVRCVLLPDSLPAEDFRRLRVWLRWKGGGGRAPT